MKQTLHVLFLLFLFSCVRPDQITPVYTYDNVPDGGTAVISNSNLSGQGTLTNRYNTNWSILNTVQMQDLVVYGTTVIEVGATLTVNGSITVAGGSKLIVKGKLICPTYTQTGDAYFSGADMTCATQFWVSGGSTLYLENAIVRLKDLRILGSLQALKNANTDAGNKYSVFYFNQSYKYLNRASGSSVCGPLLFTYNADQGTSGVNMTTETSTVLSNKSDIYSLYQINNGTAFYKYADSCSPLSSATGF